jgi:GntR family transcriptional regulator / MocR family aminotransferase
MSPRQLGALDLSLSLDHSRPMTLSRQLEDQLRNAIKSGRLAAGSRLPSTRALADDLSVSRGVVARAYAQLAAEHLLELHDRAQAVVRGDRPRTRHTEARAGGGRVRWDLRAQFPELSTFPRRQWLRSLERALATGANADLGYGDPAGHHELRQELADYLGRSRAVVADAEQIFVTAGSTQTLNLLATLLARTQRTAVAFENPSHEHFRTVAERRGLRVIGVPVDPDGIAVASLDSTPDAVVVSPLQQFPTGFALSSGRRSALTAWATQAEALIIEDDYEAGLINDRSPAPCLQQTAPDRVVYMGSASKLLAPSVCIGWCVLPRSMIAEAAEELATGLAAVATLQQLAFADFLRRGELDRHLRKARKRYRARRELLVRELQRQFHEPSLLVPAGGLHVVLELESAAVETAAQAAAAEVGVRVETVSQHALASDQGMRGLVIGYGMVVEAAVPAVVACLRAAVDRARRERACRVGSSGWLPRNENAALAG